MTPPATDADRKSAPRRHASWEALAAVSVAGVGAWILLRLPEPVRGAAPLQELGILGAGRDLAWLMILCALALPCVRGIAPLARRFRGDRPLRTACLVCVPLFLAAILLYDRTGATKTAPIGGARYFWLDDDMMISMRYAKNLASGHGLVWNAGGERVEGYSNSLWTLILSLPHLAGMTPRLASAPVIALNCLLVALMLLAAFRLGEQMRLGAGALWLALILIAANRWVVHWAVAGSENILMALLLLVVAANLLSARRGRPAGLATGLALGSIALLRADGLILMAAFAPAVVLLVRSGRLRWRALAAALALPAAHLLARRLYYGQWLPNTYYLKVRDIPMSEAMGAFYVSLFFAYWGGMCLLHVVGGALERRPVAKALALVPWVGVGYTMLIGGDELPEMRFMVPLIPLFVLGAISSFKGMARHVRAGPRRPMGRLAARSEISFWMIGVLALGAYRSLCLPAALEELGKERGRLEQANVEIGLMLRDNTNPEAVIAHYWAGAAPYFSERPAQDMLGKNDPVIARLPGRQGQWQPGHTKYDPAYSMSLEPDVVVTALPAGTVDASVRNSDPSCAGYPALCAIYTDATFEALYRPGLVPLALSRDHHAIFVRGGTRAATQPDLWR